MSKRRSATQRFRFQNNIRLGTGVVFGLVLGLVLFQSQRREPLLSSILLRAEQTSVDASQSPENSPPKDDTLALPDRCCIDNICS